MASKMRMALGDFKYSHDGIVVYRRVRYFINPAPVAASNATFFMLGVRSDNGNFETPCPLFAFVRHLFGIVLAPYICDQAQQVSRAAMYCGGEASATPFLGAEFITDMMMQCSFDVTYGFHTVSTRLVCMCLQNVPSNRKCILEVYCCCVGDIDRKLWACPHIIIFWYLLREKHTKKLPHPTGGGSLPAGRQFSGT